MKPLTILAVLALTAGAAIAQEEGRTRETYDVRFLTIQVLDFRGPDLDIGFPGSFPDDDPDPGGTSSAAEPLNGNFLVDAIRVNFDEDSWADARNSIRFDAGLITVTQTRATHAKIAAYLEMLRKRFARRIVVEGDVLRLTPEAFAAAGAGPGLLTPAQEKALRDAAEDPKRGATVTSLRTIAMNGQRVFAAEIRRQLIVGDIEVFLSEKDAIPETESGEVRSGAVLDIRPILSPDALQVVLEARFALVQLKDVRTFELGAGTPGRVQLPSRDNLRAKCTVGCPLGRSVLLCAGSDGGKTTLLLVRPTLAGEAVDGRPDSTEKRQLRIYDVALLTTPTMDFPGPDLELAPPEGADPTTTFVPPSGEGFALTPEQVQVLVRNNVSPATWKNTRNRIGMSGDQLFVVQTPDVLDEVEKFLAAATPLRVRMVAVEAAVVAFDEAGWLKRRASLSGASPAAADVAAVLEAATRGDGGRVVATARAAGLNEQRFHCWSGPDTAFVRDDDVLVSKDGKKFATDPDIGRLLAGFCLDVMPLLTGDGDRILLELRASFVAPSTPEAFDPGGPRATRLQGLRTSRLLVENLILAGEGEWSVAGISTRNDGGRREVLAVFVRARSMEAK